MIKSFLIFLSLVSCVAQAQYSKQRINSAEAKAILQAAVQGSDAQARYLKNTLEQITALRYYEARGNSIEDGSTIERHPNGEIRFEVVQGFDGPIVISPLKGTSLRLSVSGRLSDEKPPYGVKVESVSINFSEGDLTGGGASTSGGRN